MRSLLRDVIEIFTKDRESSAEALMISSKKWKKNGFALFCLIHLRAEAAAEGITFLWDSVDLNTLFALSQWWGVGKLGMEDPSQSLDTSCEMYLRIPSYPPLLPSLYLLCLLWMQTWWVFTSYSNGRNNEFGVGHTWCISVQVLWL